MSSKEALQKGLIDQHIYLLIENRIAQLHGRLPDSISINEALSWGLLLVPLGRVRNPANDRRMTIEEACDTEFLDVNRSIVIAPGTDRIMTLARAVDTGVFDLHSGDMHNFVNNKTLTFTEAVFQGYIPPLGLSRPCRIPWLEALDRGLLDLDNNLFTDPTSRLRMDIDTALK